MTPSRSASPRSSLPNPHAVPVPRSYRVATQLWEQAKAKAKSQQRSVAVLVQEAVDEQLDAVVQDLEQLGVSDVTLPDKRVRTALSRQLLQALQQARRQTTLPGNQLLGLCLYRHLDGRRRRRSKAK
ncbi:hypothetical protein ACERK3_13780 [Phycisphaerales bacterium AB-hyl4]|uniref:Uncharacterized protein n=1 Tax=Natronomicrosphaera hydrolytica TaxID=3242702 RepID=A0ABV4U6Y8_9BACT